MKRLLSLGLVLGVFHGMTAGSMPANAATWEQDAVLVPTLGLNSTLGASGRPAVADDQGRVHLVFQTDVGDLAFEIVYTVRELDGAWRTPEVISTVGRDARNATLARDAAGRLHVVWQTVVAGESDLVYRQRRADGTWDPPQALFPAPSASDNAVVAVDGFDRLHVVWIDGRSGLRQVLHAVRTEEGGWTDPETLSPNGVEAQSTTVATDGLGNTHVAWVDRGTSGPNRSSIDVLYRRIDPAGSGVTSSVRLVDHLSSVERPHLLAEEDGTVHLVWLDDRISGNVFEVYYKRFLPGIGWGHDKRFTYDHHTHGRPVIVQGGEGTLNLAWEDYANGNPEIFYRQITEGRGWDRDLTRLTSDVSSSVQPALLGLPSGELLLLWSDAQGEGAFRIFARDGTEGITSP